MLRKLHDFRRASLLLMVLLALVPACTRARLTGVGVKNLSSELVFGVPPLPEAVAPPNVGPVTQIQPRAGADDPPPPPPPMPQGPTIQPAPAQACPQADLTKQFPEEVPADVTQPIKEGFYRSRVVGTLTQGGIQVPINTTERQKVSDVDVNNTNPLNFTFNIRQTDWVRAATSVLSFQVGAAPDVRGRGIYLTKIIQQTARGTQEFVPRPAIVFANLPLRLGATFDTTSIDQRTFQVIHHTGQVRERRVVDVCGEVIDTWFIRATTSLTCAGCETEYKVDYHYAIATQLGSKFAFEYAKSPKPQDQDDISYEVSSTLMQLVPEPLG